MNNWFRKKAEQSRKQREVFVDDFISPFISLSERKADWNEIKENLGEDGGRTG